MGGRGQEVRAKGQGEGAEEESMQRNSRHPGWPCTVVQLVYRTTPPCVHAPACTQTHRHTHTGWEGAEL